MSVNIPGCIEQCAIPTQANDEVNLVSQVILALRESHELVLDGIEALAVLQKRVVQDGTLHKDDHILLLDEPVDQPDEWRDDRGVVDLLDNEDREWGLVPGQALGSWVLNGPVIRISDCICQLGAFFILTYMTIAEFFMILPHGPNCWIGLGAFRDLVLL